MNKQGTGKILWEFHSQIEKLFAYTLRWSETTARVCVLLWDQFSEAFMSFDAAFHANAEPDARRLWLSLRRVLVAILTLAVALAWSTTASASCGNYLYRNGQQVTDSSLSMNHHSENQASNTTPVGLPVPPCHGPNCSGNPIPLAPVPVAPTNSIRGFDQATILESLADVTSPSGVIEIPASERGACFEPSSLFRPPAA